MNTQTLSSTLTASVAPVTSDRRVNGKDSPETPGSRASIDDLDAYVQQQMERLRVPGVSLAVVEGDRIVHLRGFGQARPDGGPPTPQTPFFIGSLTKSFTALAVMQLVEAGKIDLDVPVQRYLPWFRIADPQASAQMTVRHLLIQTGGLPTSAGEVILADGDDRPGAAERQARALSSLALARPVGSAFEYSNANYLLLGLIIEAAGGESYADYVQRHIFDPLGMGHTYTSPALARKNGLAAGHQYWFGRPVAAPDVPLPHGSLAAALLISTAEDLARYVIAHLNGGRYGDTQLLSAGGIDELHRGAVDCGLIGLGPIERFLAKNVELGQYGMGWCVDQVGQTPVVWHGGTLPDFGAYMALLPEQKRGIVLLFNVCHHWLNPVYAEFGTGATALLAGEQPAALPFSRILPWMLRAQLLIPAFQIADVAATLRRLRKGTDPQRRTSTGRVWGLHMLVPLILNLLVALTLKPVLGKRRGYLRLYMPDFSWIARVCGSFALVWSLIRTGLSLRAWRRREDCPPLVEDSRS
jgi:CubicO group peptidase (beta-lactamase class C family)